MRLKVMDAEHLGLQWRLGATTRVNRGVAPKGATRCRGVAGSV